MVGVWVGWVGLGVLDGWFVCLFGWICIVLCLLVIVVSSG